MKLGNRKLKASVLIVTILIVSLGLYVYSRNTGLQNDVANGVNQEFPLVRPAFAQSMAAATTFLDQEAGIAIWFNATFAAPLDLNAAANAMVNIEGSTSEYVIGSLSDNGGIASSDDYPHCFVDKGGWIVVYYLKVNTQNPATTGWLGKIIDWSQYSNNELNGTFLSEGLNYISTKTIGMPPTNEQYYHFQYPNATELLLAIKHASDGTTATFNIEIPSTIGTIYEESWSCYSTTAAGTLQIDNNTICSSPGSGSPPAMSTSDRQYGGTEVSYQMISFDVFHTVSITAAYGYSFEADHWPNDAYGCLLLLYS